jgi:glycosyltransferase involved in cell wall biosynthesis
MDKSVIIPLVSVIIPCFNAGNFLLEAIRSVECYPDKSIYEIIITNDGSTDSLTLELLAKLMDENYHIIHQENRGPAAARNMGISASRGSFLLFLDSDNKIRDNFIDLALKIFNEDRAVGVVYGDPCFFGENTSPRFRVGEFDLDKIIMDNYIDMCSMIRKQVWLDVGPLDEDRVLIGHEDWEYWIRIGSSKWELRYVKEVLYDYRIGNSSLVMHTVNDGFRKKIRNYIFIKHLDVLLKSYTNLYWNKIAYNRDMDSPLRSYLKYLYIKYLKK